MRLLILMLLLSTLAFTGKSVAQQLNCQLFCVTDIRMSPGLPGSLDITIWNGDTNGVNYPIVQLIDNNGDTVANDSGDFFFFVHISGVFLTHQLQTSLTSVPPGFTGTVLIRDPLHSVSCLLPFPCATVNLNEIDDAEISVFPNPSSEQIFVSFSEVTSTTDLQFDLLDMQGKKQKIEAIASNGFYEISVGHLNAGLYILRIDRGGEILHSKVLIQH